MTDIAELRNAITGLLAYAGAEEEMLLATARRAPVVSGRPDCWAAIPFIAHNTEFKRQQVRRLTAIRPATRRLSSPRSITDRPRSTSATRTGPRARWPATAGRSPRR